MPMQKVNSPSIIACLVYLHSSPEIRPFILQNMTTRTLALGCMVFTVRAHTHVNTSTCVWTRSFPRLCGRPFCYYCCSNTVSTQQGGARERCCSDCYSQHSAVVERHPQQDVGSAAEPPFGPLPQPGRTASSSAGREAAR